MMPLTFKGRGCWRLLSNCCTALQTTRFHSSLLSVPPNFTFPANATNFLSHFLKKILDFNMSIKLEYELTNTYHLYEYQVIRA